MARLRSRFGSSSSAASPSSSPAPPLRRQALDTAIDTFAVACSLTVLLLYAFHASALIAYPWDWSPDEGLTLDYARRLWEAPRTLYARQVVPYPLFYNPLMPVLLAPLVQLTAAPLAGARLLALTCTAALTFCTYRLASPETRRPLALVAAALALAPFDLSFWHLLVRVDGLMTALWLAAAAVLLPSTLARGSAHLAWPRVLLGGSLLVASVLAKPTAVVHGLPLVAGWFLVDFSSARRLLLAVGAMGLAALAALQVATSGGYLWVMGLWLTHPKQPGLLTGTVGLFLDRTVLVLLFALVASFLVWRRDRAALRDGALLLVVGGLLIVPTLAKGGAMWNYLLPLLSATIILGARWWARANPRLGSLVGGALALGLALTREFALPTPLDRATSDAFYAYVQERGQPLLATRPEYTYFLVGQPVEMEGSGFNYLVAAGAPGITTLRQRVEARHYRLIVLMPGYWPQRDGFPEALERGYRLVGACSLRYFYGLEPFLLLVPRDDPTRFAPPPETRCRSL
jgi:hypothetical protein